jgi:formate dehydrogenase subunit gamma
VSNSHVISSEGTAGETGGRILRYTLSERVHHWLGAFTYCYCLITGLAFWSPYMFWLAVLVGGGPTARFWHPWLGLAFTLSMFWMYKMWRPDMLTTDADRRWSKAMKYYIENEDEKLPPSDDSTTARSCFSG